MIINAGKVNLEVFVKILSTEAVMRYVCDKKECNLRCANGIKICPNFGKKYSCPPKAPLFSSYKERFKYMFVVGVYFSGDEYRRVYQNTTIPIITSLGITHRVTKGNLKKVLCHFDSVLHAGACNRCKECNLVKNLPCAYSPDIPLEATGIDVCAMVDGIGWNPVEWYIKGSKKINNTYAIGGILSNDKEATKERLKQVLKRLKGVTQGD